MTAVLGTLIDYHTSHSVSNYVYCFVNHFVRNCADKFIIIFHNGH